MKADYSKIARFYDRGRPLSDQNMQMWLRLVRERSEAIQGANVLDLGCGTGRFALPMARSLGYKVTGVDASPEMLAKARSKDPDSQVVWDCQNAMCLQYPDACFDAVFLSHLLHHVDDPQRVIAECHRVLRSTGTLLIRYGAIEQILDDAEHTLFPQTAQMDKARTPSVRDTEGWLRTAGFAQVQSQEVVQQTYSDGRARLQAATNRSTSVLTMLDAAAFGEGLARLARHVQERPDDPWLLIDRLTLTVGRKT
jgi:SAM-dependent methyltransferase